MLKKINFTKDKLVQLISEGSDPAIKLGDALEDAFENQIDLGSPQILIGLGGRAASIEFDQDKSQVKITATSSQKGIAPKAHTDPKIEMTFDVEEDGSFTLSALQHEELWSGDTGFIKGWMATCDIDLENMDYSANVINLFEKSGFVEHNNKWGENNAQARRETYAKESATADRIEAAQHPDDIADIIADHQGRLAQKAEADEALAYLKEQAENDGELKQFMDDIESLDQTANTLFGNKDHSNVSKVIMKARDAEDFGIAAALYRNHFVHTADRDAKYEAKTIPDRSEVLDGSQRIRLEMFGRNSVGNPYEVVEDCLKDAGHAISNSVALYLKSATKQMADMTEYAMMKSENMEQSTEAMETGHSILKVFSDVVQDEDVVAFFSPSELSPAEGLQSLLNSADPLNPDGSICNSGWEVQVNQLKRQSAQTLKAEALAQG